VISISSRGGRWRWLAIDLVLAIASCVAALGLIREVVERRPLPVTRARAEARPRPPAGSDDMIPLSARAAAPVGPAAYDVIATRNLFAAARGEVVAMATAAMAGIPSILHGVVIDGERSRAYLDDPVAKRVFGYAVGDAVAGGRLEQILDDRVKIRRLEGAVVEVLLKDPSKPPSKPLSNPNDAPPATPVAMPEAPRLGRAARRGGSQPVMASPAPAPANPALPAAPAPPGAPSIAPAVPAEAPTTPIIAPGPGPISR